MTTGGRQQSTRESRERTRVYQARQAFHVGRSRRRTRDNLIAGIGGGLLILAIIGGQTAYFTVGPGAPVPDPVPTPTATITPSTPAPTPTPTVSETPSAEPSDSPTATPAP